LFTVRQIAQLIEYYEHQFSLCRRGPGDGGGRGREGRNGRKGMDKEMRIDGRRKKSEIEAGREGRGETAEKRQGEGKGRRGEGGGRRE